MNAFQKIGLGVSIAMVAAGSPAFAGQDKCEEGRAAMLTEASDFFDPAIKANDDLLAEITAKGGNPADLAFRLNGELVTFAAYNEKLHADRQATIDGANEEADGCNKSLDPYQKAVDAMTGGIAGLPGKMGHIDVSQILAGYPLGGPNALIPHLREQIFKALGMGRNNDLRKIIENPLGGKNSFFHKELGL